MVIAVLGLFGITRVGRRGRVDGHEVGDWACCEKCTFEDRLSGLSSRDAYARTKDMSVLRLRIHSR